MNPEVSVLVDPSRRAFDGAGAVDGQPGRPVRVHRWRADRDDAPLVVLSHGTGGAAVDLEWWSRGLCDAGFDVVAIDHHGHNWVDGYVAEAFAWWWDRPVDVSFVLDRVPARGPVGAAGFSIGGYTAAAVCGARILRDAYLALVSGQVEGPPTPEYPGLREELLARYGAGVGPEWAAQASADHRDGRVRAGFWLCPGFGPLIDPASLAAVDIPVAVRWTAADQTVPPEEVAARYAGPVPGADSGAVGTPTSGHYGLVLERERDDAARNDVVADSVAFFRRALG